MRTGFGHHSAPHHSGWTPQQLNRGPNPAIEIPSIDSLNVNVIEPCAITALITAAESLMTVLQTAGAGGTASGGDSRGAISADVNPGTAPTLMLSTPTQVTGVMLRRCFSAGLFSCRTLMTFRRTNGPHLLKPTHIMILSTSRASQILATRAW